MAIFTKITFTSLIILAALTSIVEASENSTKISECRSEEIGMAGYLNNVYYSEWTLRTLKISQTGPSVFLIQDGIIDLNNEGRFQIGEQWSATETVAGSRKIFTSINNSRKSITLTLNAKNQFILNQGNEEWQKSSLCE